MVSTAGSRLMEEDAANTLIEKLLPLATVITPNLAEAEVLCGFAIKTKEDCIKAAQTISQKIPTAILIKGGHLEDTADDLLWDHGEIHWV